MRWNIENLNASELCDFDMNKVRTLLPHSGDQFRETKRSWIDEGHSCFSHMFIGASLHLSYTAAWL
jgi:hypothetical protein